MAKFICNTDWVEAIKCLSGDIRLEVYEAIFEYALSGKQPRLKKTAEVAFSFIKIEMDYNAKQYEEKRQRRAEAGRKGGMAKKSRTEKRNDDADSKANNENSETSSENSDILKNVQAGQTKKLSRKPKLCSKKEAMPSNAKQCQAMLQMPSNESIYEYEYEYDNNNNVVISYPDGISAHVHTREENSPAAENHYFDEMQQNVSWRENICIKFKISDERCLSLIADFRQDCLLRQRTHSSQQDTYSHFVSWLPIRLRIEQENLSQNEHTQTANRRMPQSGNTLTARQQREAETLGTINRLLARAHEADEQPTD